MKGIHTIKVEVVQKWKPSVQVYLKVLRQTLGGLLIFTDIPR